MKHVLSLFLAILMISALGIAQTKQQKKDKKPAAKIETATIKVESAVCGSCESIIEAAAKRNGGAQEASVDIEKKIATVKFNPEKTSLSKIEHAIADAGYDANAVDRNEEAYEKLDSCCKVEKKK